MEYQRPIFDITIDEALHLGVDEVAFVHDPAIQELFIAMAKEEIIKLAMNEDKMIVTGPVLIPDKLIFRIHPKTGEEYYIRFSAEVIQQIVLRYFTQNKQINFNLEHNKENSVQGVILESWIVDNPQLDKSAAMGFKMPVGTWMASVKVEDQQFWNDYVKTGKVRGFSIEGSFGQQLHEVMAEQEKLVEPKKGETQDEYIGRCVGYHVSQEGYDPSQAAAICYSKWDEAKMSKEELASYNDYPEAAKQNAQRALDWAEQNGWGDCGTPVGKQRANQLAKGEPISEETIARMAAFERHRQNSTTPYGEGCGKLMWDAWGGDEGIAWAQRKLEQIQKLRIGEKIGYDYDGTLSTRIGQAMAAKDIKSGATVYIVSARSNASGMYAIADKLGIPHDRVFAMGGNIAKVEKVKELGLDTFYDNNRNVKRMLPRGIGVNFTLSTEEAQVLIEAILMSKYEYPTGDFLSGFSEDDKTPCDYELACQDMVIRGVEYFDAHPELHELISQGGVSAFDEVVQPLIEFMCQGLGEGATGAMVEHTAKHAYHAYKVGWEEYISEITSYHLSHQLSKLKSISSASSTELALNAFPFKK